MLELIPSTALPLGFQAFGVAAAVPCLVVIGAFVRARCAAKRPPPRPMLDGVRNPDGVLLVLGGIERSVTLAAGFLGGLGRAVLAWFALLATFGLALAAGLWWTGRGLAAGAPWARPAAYVLMGVLALAACSAAAGTRGRARFAAAAVAAAAFASLVSL